MFHVRISRAINSRRKLYLRNWCDPLCFPFPEPICVKAIITEICEQFCFEYNNNYRQIVEFSGKL